MASMKNENPHKIPPERIAWLSTASRWENPLKVVLGPSDTLHALDGRPFIRVAELYAPEKCSWICHPDNFSPMDNFAKRIALGEIEANQFSPL